MSLFSFCLKEMTKLLSPKTKHEIRPYSKDLWLREESNEVLSYQEIKQNTQTYSEQLQTFVENGRYLKNLHEQNQIIIDELDKRVARILEFGNKINEFEDSLNEREGNALRLLAEPELDYKPKRDQIKLLEEGIGDLEKQYNESAKTLSFEAIKEQINAILERTAEVEAENAQREMNLEFRRGMLEFNKMLARPLQTEIPVIEKPEYHETPVSYSFDGEKERMDDLHERAEKIYQRKLKVQQMRRELKKLQQEKDEIIQNSKQNIEQKRIQYNSLKDTAKLYDDYRIQLDNLRDKQLRQEIEEKDSLGELRFKLRQLASGVEGHENTQPVPETYISNAKTQLDKERFAYNSYKAFKEKHEAEYNQILNEVQEIEGKVNDSKLKIEEIEAEIQKYVQQEEEEEEEI